MIFNWYAEEKSAMPNYVTLTELTELAIRAYDNEQQTLAGCLYMIIHASEQMNIDGLFVAMASYNQNTLEVQEEAELNIEEEETKKFK